MAKQVAITVITLCLEKEGHEFFKYSKQIFWMFHAYMYTGGVMTRGLNIPPIVSVSYDCINPTT